MDDSPPFIKRLKKRLDEAKLNSERFEEVDYAHSQSLYDEKQLAAELKNRLSGTNWAIHLNVRVPDAAERKRTEIDFVITAPDRVIVLELKSWTGSASIDDDGNITQTRRDKTTVAAGKLLAKLSDQADILDLYNQSLGNAPVTIDHLLVFYYEDIQLDATLASHKDVITLEKLREFLPEAETSKNIFERIITAIMRMFGYESDSKQREKGMKPIGAIVQIRECLDRLGTWDYIKLHGGREIKGDIIHKANPEDSNAVNALSRSEDQGLRFDVERSALRAFFVSLNSHANVNVVRWDGTRTIKRISTSQELLIHPAGSKKPEVFHIRNIVELNFGYKERHQHTHKIEELPVGKKLVGKVINDNQAGVFVNIGLTDKDGKALAVRAPAKTKENTNFKNFRRGQRVLIEVKRVLTHRQQVDISIIHPAC